MLFIRMRIRARWEIDTVDIYQIADKKRNLIIFHGFIHRFYVVEHDDEPVARG
ncbi:hypothetical protein [Mammaliicoccus sciuri]|uniref:hypothetical protein n=1 Tax=Mammaliicoccus sciuri TaxID=1296 RepID=UPI001304BD44|nr:hypothetical protein [Mammaliicoccus sciuri]